MNDPHKPRIFSGPGTIGSAHKIVSGGGSPKANNGVQHYKSIKTQPSFTKDETTAGASLEQVQKKTDRKDSLNIIDSKDMISGTFDSFINKVESGRTEPFKSKTKTEPLKEQLNFYNQNQIPKPDS